MTAQDPPKPTLLCVFVHGFKGDDNTFGSFPAHLRVLLQNALPYQDIRLAIYPRFETRGELVQVVVRFRDWLQTQVIDIEVEKQTPSPTVNPSVRVALLGHSMGGIVIADTLLAIAQETVITTNRNSSTPTDKPSKDPHLDPAESPLLFPRILCLLAFDTPYLGINPSVLAHGVEQHYSTASSAYSALSMLWPAASTTPKSTPNPPSPSPASTKAPLPPLPPPTPTAASSWTRSLLYGATAVTAASIAAGAAYASRNQISKAVGASREGLSTGYEFMTSHLLFVNTLLKPELLKVRMKELERVCQELGIPWACQYTVLGDGGVGKGGKGPSGSGVWSQGQQLTFCNLPVKGSVTAGGGQWVEARNDKAVDAVQAHMGMFFPTENPNYYVLAERSKELIASWCER